jgi:hypothetical protein
VEAANGDGATRPVLGDAKMEDGDAPETNTDDPPPPDTPSLNDDEPPH